MWSIESDNDTGPEDDYFIEWWTVSDGERSYTCRNEKDAEWLRDLLNKISDSAIDRRQQGE